MAYYQKDQLPIKTRKILADYLADLIVIADSIESFRLALAQTQFFNGIELFRWLDQDQKGYLTPKDFAILVSDDTKKIFHYAFSWFDVSKAGEITRAQFLQFLFPKTNLQLRDLVSAIMTQEYLPQEKKSTLPIQQDLLRGLILQIMQRQTRLIPMRRILMDQKDYTLKAVMNCLDVEGRGWITTGDLYKFLRNFDVQVSGSSVCAMLGVYDNDMNGKIEIKELEWLIEGLQNSSSTYRQTVRNSDRKAKQKLGNSRCICGKIDHKSSQKARNTVEEQAKIRTDKKKSKKDHNLSAKSKVSNKNEVNQFKQEVPQSSKKQKKQKKIKKTVIETKSDYLELKNAFHALLRQTQLIDQDLKRIEQQMGTKTLIQFQKQLQNAQIKRKIKMQEQELIQRRMRDLQIAKEREIARRIKEQQTFRLIQQENRRKLELQLERSRALERQNQYLRQVQETRRREAELQSIRLRNLQEIRIKQADHRRKIQLQQSIRATRQLQLQLQSKRNTQIEKVRLQQLHRIKQMELRNLIINEKLSQDQLYDRQIRFNNERSIKMAQSQLDWGSEYKLRLLHEGEVRERRDISQKQNEYFWRYNNYCQKLATVVDPLGIKQHLAQTDKYLIKSKQLRDQIKRDRAVSLNRYSHMKSSHRNKSKVNTQNDEGNQKTPQQERKDVIDTINKRTEQTKLVWT